MASRENEGRCWCLTFITIIFTYVTLETIFFFLATTAQPQTDGQAGEQFFTDSTPDPESTSLTSGDLPEVQTSASNPPEATTSTSPTQPSNIDYEATNMPESSTLEPASNLDGTSEPDAEQMTASPVPQDEEDQTAITKLPTEEAQDDPKDSSAPDATSSTDDPQTGEDDVPQNPVTQDSDDQGTTIPTANPNVQEHDQSNNDAETEVEGTTPSTVDTHVDDDTLTSRPQDVDGQATTTAQPIDQGQDDATPEPTQLTTDALTNGDDVTSNPLPQGVDDQTTTATTKPAGQELDDAITEATPTYQTGLEDVTKSPTDEVQDGTTAESTPEVSTADPLNVTPDTTIVTLKPQDKPVPPTVLPAKPDQERPGTKPEIKPQNPSGNIDDTTGYQGGKNINAVQEKDFLGHYLFFIFSVRQTLLWS